MENKFEMLDTVVLTLKRDKFSILEPDSFSPSASRLLDTGYRLGGRANMRCYQNPSKRELNNGIYKPRLTLTGRINKEHNFEAELRIEASIPKLLYKNNFNELEDKDFYDAVILLSQKLEDMGVRVDETDLVSAQISLVHFGKNILLDDGSIPFTYLNEIRKANITKRLDFNQTDFRNEGHSTKFRANYFEVIFYDKKKDLEKAKISDKRAEEKDNSIQINLFEENPIKRPFEVMRMEVRLNQRQKIRQILAKIGLNIEPTFQNLFNTEISKKVLSYYLNEIEVTYPKMLYFKPKTTKDFLAQFIIDNPKSKLNDSILALGFYTALDDVSTREIRELLKRYPLSSWYSFIKRMNSFNYTQNKSSPFQVIKNAINEFKPLKLVDYQDELLNNDKYEASTILHN